MANAIKQRITLEGTEEVNKQFDDLASGFEKAVSRIETAGNVIGNLVKAAAVGAGAFIALGTALAAITKSASSALDAIDSLATRMGSASEDVAGLESALIASGASVEDITSGFTNLARNVFQQWPEIQKQIRGAGVAAKETQLNVQRAAQGIAAAELSVRGALLASSKAQTELGRIDQEISDQRVRNAQNVRSAQLSLIDAQDRLKFLLTGEQRDPESQRALEIAKARLAVDEARQRVAEALRKKQQEEADAASRRAQAELAAEQARQQIITTRAQKEVALLQLQKARSDAVEKEANDIRNLQRFVDNLAKGFKEVGTNVNASAENIAKGFIASIGPAAEKLKGLGGSLSELAGSSPDLAKQVLRLADVLKATGDEALNTAILTKLLGRNVSGDLVQAMSQGSASLRKTRAELQALGLTLTKDEIDAGSRFTKAFDALSGTLSLIKNKIGAIFAPLGADILTRLNDSLKKNGKEILKFFEELEVTIREFVRDAPEQLLAFGRSVLTFFKVTLPVAFGALKKTLDGVAASIKQVTGFELTGNQLGIGLLIGQFTGLNNVLIGVISLVTQLGVLLLALAFSNPFTALLLAATLFFGAMILFWPQMRAAAASMWEQIKADAQTAWTFILSLGTAQRWQPIWDGIAAGSKSVWAQVQADAQTAWDFIANLKLSQSFWAALDEGSAAAWAQVKQDAQVAWDFILSLGSVDRWQALWAGIAAGFKSMWDQVKQDAEAVGRFISALWDRIIEKIRIAGAASVAETPGGALGDVRMATGGVIRGRGTGTSDSILAWLSNGEGVLTARALRHYGPGIVAAINSLRFPKFSMGGIADGMARNFAIPRFADGGIALAGAGGGHAVTINFNGRSIGGLSASSDALRELQRASTEAQMVSTARRQPSWVK